jgi:dCMP deaminase
MRPYKHEVFMAIAEQLATLGTCDRNHVGALVVKDGRCITWGYNGAPTGLPHCDENFHGWARAYDRVGLTSDEALDRYGCVNATHAEANALAYAARQGISTDEGTLYVTLSPCSSCARLLIAGGISFVYYRDEYRDTRGLELIELAGGKAVKIGESHL